jgi:hypothetical protein
MPPASVASPTRRSSPKSSLPPTHCVRGSDEPRSLRRCRPMGAGRAMKRHPGPGQAVRRSRSNAYLDRLNRTTVSAELLGEVIEMHSAMPAEDRPALKARAIRLSELLERKKLKSPATLAMAINPRLEAFARLCGDGRLRRWRIPGDGPGAGFIHADVLKAAAEEPLIEDAAGLVAFDADSFHRRVLANAESRGRA